MICHLGGARSLREIIGGLAASEGKLKHLGVERAPTRSTLAYANQGRPWQLYETASKELVKVCQCEAREKQRKFRFQHPMLSLDSTAIPVGYEDHDIKPRARSWKPFFGCAPRWLRYLFYVRRNMRGHF